MVFMPQESSQSAEVILAFENQLNIGTKAPFCWG